MTPEEVYNLWAPQESVWSSWVLPVPFIGLVCLEGGTRNEPPKFHFHLEWLFERSIRETALVVDLPGADAIHCGLSLLERGFRPIPVIDGAPAPSQRIVSPHHFSLTNRPTLGSAVDMRNLLVALCEGTHSLKTARLDPNAPPAFLLDSNRMSVKAPVGPDVFDNRWTTFPQDFPSAQLLLAHGIHKVVFIHDSSVRQPPEDLAHVLLRWQEAGIAMESKSARTQEPPEPMNVSRPSHFRAAWYRALQIFGLRRSDAGGFGGYPPQVSGGG